MIRALILMKDGTMKDLLCSHHKELFTYLNDNVELDEISEMSTTEVEIKDIRQGRYQH